VDVSDDRFGSDKAGLLCGYTFRPGHAGRPIDADDAADLLDEPSEDDPGAFVWLHFNIANQAARRWLHERLTLPESFEASFTHVMSTRVEVEEQAVVAVLNDVRLFGVDASDVSTMVLCASERLLVSARQAPLRSVDRLRESVKAGEAFRSPMDLLAHLLRDQASMLVQIVRDATVEVDRIEDRLIANQVMSSRGRLGSLRRTLVRLKRLLAPEPAALFRLLNRPPSWIDPNDVHELRLSAEELAAAVADCVALIERVRLLQEEVFAFVNEQTNKTLFVLTVVTVVALPMTIIPGLFGMNVGGVPMQDEPAGFWIMAALAIGLPALIGFLVVRSRGREF
jgi:zinc transporter